MEEEDGYDSELARWLEDAGHRRSESPRVSAEALLDHLRHLTGKRLASREDIAEFLKELEAREAERRRQETRRRTIRETILLGVLLVAALQYYYWDVQIQINSMQHIVVFVPDTGAGGTVQRPGKMKF